MNMSREEYGALVKKVNPPSPWGNNLWKAFLVGGLICCCGQGLLWLYQGILSLEEESAATAASITLVALSALTTGLGWYDDLARFAGAGTLVPITGFSNAVASPALEFKTEGLIPGTAVKLFSIAGPVIVYGTCTGILYGLILWVLQIFGCG